MLLCQLEPHITLSSPEQGMLQALSTSGAVIVLALSQ